MPGKSGKPHDALHRAADYTPRYLFRLWYFKSGGSSKLDTETTITPSAFLENDNPPLLSKHTRYDLICLMHQHLENRQRSTVFSSWSQSVAWILSWAAKACYEDGDRSVHISIMDTQKLGPNNVVLPVETWQEVLGGSFPVYECEYLAFGVIGPEAHRAVPFPHIAAHSISCLTSRKMHFTRYLPAQQAQVIDGCVKVGQLFHDSPLELAVVVSLFAITGCDAGTYEKMMEHLLRQRVPPDMAMDNKLHNATSMRIFGAVYADTMRAAVIFEDLLRRTSGLRTGHARTKAQYPSEQPLGVYDIEENVKRHFPPKPYSDIDESTELQNELISGYRKVKKLRGAM